MEFDWAARRRAFCFCFVLFGPRFVFVLFVFVLLRSRHLPSRVGTFVCNNFPARLPQTQKVASRYSLSLSTPHQLSHTLPLLALRWYWPSRFQVALVEFAQLFPEPERPKPNMSDTKARFVLWASEQGILCAD